MQHNISAGLKSHTRAYVSYRASNAKSLKAQDRLECIESVQFHARARLERPPWASRSPLWHGISPPLFSRFRFRVTPSLYQPTETKEGKDNDARKMCRRSDWPATAQHGNMNHAKATAANISACITPKVQRSFAKADPCAAKQ